jgi:uncharacterized protein YjbI with pentapeptide repeats
MMMADRRPARGVAAAIIVAMASVLPVTANAADVSARDIASLLFRIDSGTRPALNGMDLRRLDLADLDFKSANLSRSDFFGADLSGANLSNTDLSGAKLDRVTLVGARLDGADLDNASILRPSTFSTLVPLRSEAPSLKAVSMRGAKFFGTFAGSNFAGADLTDSNCAPDSKSGFIEHIWRTDFTSANLSHAKLTRIDATRADFSFANLRGAVLRDAIMEGATLAGADLRNADLTGADLTNADLTDANVTGAELAGVKLRGVTGLDSVIGLALAHNSDKTIR